MSKKTILLFLLVFILLFTGLSFVLNKPNKEVSLHAKGAIVMRMDDHKILFEKEAHTKLIPGSLTKLISLLIVFENIEAGNLSLSDPVLVSEAATGTFASKAGLKAGESLCVDDLLKCVFLPSGSDALIALAEHLYGSQESFVEEMNRRAELLGLENSHFTNCMGLEDRDHYSSAYDIGKIALELTSKYPEAYEYSSLPFTVISHEDGSDLFLKNTNDMLEYDGVDGLKTGSTPNGGYSLAMTYHKGEKHLLFVTIGSESLYFRKQDCKKLLEAFQ